MGSNPAAAGWLAGGPADRLAGREGAAGMFAPAAVINAVHAATGAGPATHPKFCFWVRQRFACWRAKFPGRLTSDIPPTTISHCCGLTAMLDITHVVHAFFRQRRADGVARKPRRGHRLRHRRFVAAAAGGPDQPVPGRGGGGHRAVAPPLTVATIMRLSSK